jgi:hypothetical protein
MTMTNTREKNSVNKWRLRRTYEDFERLQYHLLNRMKQHNIAPVMEQTRSGSLFKKKMSNKVLMEKKTKWQTFLNSILKESSFRELGVVLMFLGIKSRHGSINFAANYANEMNSWLMVRNASDSEWKPRFVVLKDNLLYFLKDDLRKGNAIEPLGHIPLCQTLVTENLTAIDMKKLQQDTKNVFKIENFIESCVTYFTCLPHQKGAKKMKNQWINILKIISGRSSYNLETNHDNQPPVHRAGYMTKLGDKVQNWKQRFFILDNYNLFYFVNENATTPRGRIDISGSTVRLYSNEESMKLVQKEHVISIETAKRKWWLLCADANEKQEWESAIFQGSMMMKGETRLLNTSTNLSNLISASNDCDTIIVEPGVYQISDITISKSLIIKALDPFDRPVFEASDTNPILNLKGRCVILDNIHFKSNASECVIVSSGNVIVRSCHLSSKENNALVVEKEGRLIASTSSFFLCELKAAIQVRGGKLYLEKCSLYECNSAISITDSSECDINNCCISDNNNGIICESSSNSRLIVHKTKIFNNLSSGIHLSHIPDILRIFDNHLYNNLDAAIHVEQSSGTNRKLQGCIVDNVIQNKDDEKQGLKHGQEHIKSIVEEKELQFKMLDLDTIVHILRFVSFPLGQCLCYLRSFWLNHSYEKYEEYESILLHNLYGYKYIMEPYMGRYRSKVLLLYRSLDLSISDKSIDLTLFANNGIIPLVNVSSLLLNELWIEKNGLKLINPLEDCLTSLTINHCPTLHAEELERLYTWLEYCSAIGKNVQLDLTGTAVSMKLLSRLQNVSILKLRPVHYSQSEETVLSKFMEKCGPTLQNLELSYYPLGIKGLDTIFSHSKNCQRLVLMGIGLGGMRHNSGNSELIGTPPSSFQIIPIFQSYLLNNFTLTHLNMKDNTIGDDVVKVIAQCPKLKYLNLEECGLTSKALIAILTYSKSIEILNLAVNMIDDEGLYRSLLEGNVSLRSLNLSFNPLITSDGFCNLVYNSTLNTLIIHGCAGNLTDSVVQCLCRMNSLLSLQISGNELTYNSLLYLTQSRITHLDASYNFITDEGAMLCVQHSRLKHLNLAGNKLTWIGARELFQSTSIEYLDLSQNIDIDDSTPSTIRALEKNEVLKHLILANLEGIRRQHTIEVLLTRNRTLEHINLCGTNITSDSIRTFLDQQISINPNLQQLAVSNEHGLEILTLMSKHTSKMRIFVS